VQHIYTMVCTHRVTSPACSARLAPTRGVPGGSFGTISSPSAPSWHPTRMGLHPSPCALACDFSHWPRPPFAWGPFPPSRVTPPRQLSHCAPTPTAVKLRPPPPPPPLLPSLLVQWDRGAGVPICYMFQWLNVKCMQKRVSRSNGHSMAPTRPRSMPSLSMAKTRGKSRWLIPGGISSPLSMAPTPFPPLPLSALPLIRCSCGAV